MRSSLSQRAPTRGSLRELIVEVLPGDADLDAFSGDLYEREVYRRFTLGMDRVQKINLLLDHGDRREILDGLRRLHPDEVGRHEHLLAWEPPRRAVLARRGLLAVVPVLFVALVFTGWWLMRMPPIEPFEPGAGGVVIVGPWLATAGGNELCRELGELDVKHAVRCVASRLRASSAGELRARAQAAGALVVATVTEEGVASVSAIGRLEKDALFGGTIRMDLSREADRKRAAIVIDVLARLGAPRPGFEPDRVPCPEVGPEPLDRGALLALLVVPACDDVKLDPRRYEESCGAGAPGTDEACALGQYLEVEAYPAAPNARSILTWLRDSGPERFRAMAKLKLAREDCKAGHVSTAAQAALELARGDDGNLGHQGSIGRATLAVSGRASTCLQAQASAVAACVAWQTKHIAPQLAALEGLAVGPEDARECPEQVLASALEARAHWRGRAGRWQAAARDYEGAYALYHAPEYALTEAEALLHQKRTKEAGALLKAPVDKRELSVYAALLRWAASRQQDDPIERKLADSGLLGLYAGLPAGKPLVEGEADDDLRALLCEEAGRPCVYDLLRGPSTKEELVRLLDGPQPDAGHGTSR